MRTTEFFGKKEPLSEQEKIEVSKIRSDLEFDDKAINNIAEKVFHGMKGQRGCPSGELSRDDLRRWTQAIMAKKYPDKKFSEAAFEQGFNKLDANRDGQVNIEDIKLIVMKKVKKENLYVGK